MLLALLAACTDDSAPPFGSSGGKDTSVEDYPPAEDLEFSAELAEIPTVVLVEYANVGDAAVRVEYGATPDYGYVATGAEGVAELIGNHADADVHFRLLVDGPDGTMATADQVIHTGGPPSGLPSFELQTPTSDDWHGLVLVPTVDLITGESMVVLLDRDGEIVWWYGVEASVLAVRRGPGGELLLLEEAWRDGTVTRIESQSWRGDPGAPFVETPEGHHDFTILPDGTFAVLESDIRDWDGETVVGDKLVEYGAAGERTIWSTWDDLDPDDRNPNAMPTEAGVDWTHVNGVDYDEVTDRYVVSVYWLGEVLALDRSTGAIAWQLGGDDSDFDIVGDPGFGPQHAPTFVEGGLLMYDNHDQKGGDDTQVASRAVRYALDFEAWTAATVWQYEPVEGLHEGVLGDAGLLVDGSYIVNNGKSGTIAVVGVDGDVRFSAKATGGESLGRGLVIGPDLTVQ